ncbi:hypothetical protein EDB83DRAFT_2390880 [Lactarius deliciosus]|nr:hypothetical protein EDB83DRAFT_2390880 [Lactarius deliciosus]
MTAGMLLLGAYQGGLSTFVHDYPPQGRRPVNVVNPRYVRLFRSMIGSWSPASVDLNCHLSFKLQASSSVSESL